MEITGISLNETFESLLQFIRNSSRYFSLLIIQAEVYGVLGGVTLFTMGSLTARPRKAETQTPLRKSTLIDAIAPILHSLMRSTLGRIHLRQLAAQAEHWCWQL